MADDPPDDEGKVLSPDELDITDDQHVSELEEGRYLISPDEPAPETEEPVEVHDHGTDPPEEPEEGPVELDAAAVNDWLEEHVADTGAEYGFHITATFEGRVARQELYSDDVVTTFDNLLTWYTQNVGRDTPVEEALAILLLEANTPIRFPPEVVAALVKEQGLSPEDSIADLLAAVEERDGFRLSR
ncbi:MAG: hypothetical protein ABEH77_06355 [Halobacteriaceae archaeon]